MPAGDVSIRKVHSKPCPVAADGGLVIFGTASGSVMCCDSKKKWNAGPAVWTDSSSHKDAIVAVAINYNSKLALSSDASGNVYVHEHIELHSSTRKLLCRSTAPVRSLEFDRLGTRAILGGDTVRVIDLATLAVQVIPVPVPSPIVSVAVSPCETMCAVASANRAVAIAPLVDGATKMVMRDALDPEVKTSDAIDVKMAWVSKGDSASYALCLPAQEGIRVFGMLPNKTTFGQLSTLQVTNDCIGVVASRSTKNAVQLIVVTTTGDVHIAKVDDSKWKILSCAKYEQALGVAYWSLDRISGNSVWMSDEGVAALTQKIAKGAHAAQPAAASGGGGGKTAQSHPSREAGAESSNASEADDDEDLGEVVVDLIKENPHYLPERAERSKQPVTSSRGGRRLETKLAGLIDDEAEEADSDEEEEEGESASDDDDEGDEGDEPEPEHDDDDGAARDRFRGFQHDSASEGVPETRHRDFARREVHAPVQIGATPGAEHRYLAFNSIGAITWSADGGVLIVFHDKARGVMRLNRKGSPTIGALGVHSAAVVFVTSTADGAQRHELCVKSFVPGGSDWTLVLPPFDTPIVVAQCKRFTVLIGTTYMRVFSTAGVEEAVLSVPRVVAATGLNTSRCPQYDKQDSMDPLALVREVGGGLRLEILNVEQNGDIIEAPIEVTTTPLQGGVMEASLKWMGWSDDGFFYVADSAGVVRMLTRGWGRAWVPVLDIRVTHDASGIWPWAVSEDKILAYLLPSMQDSPDVAQELAPPQFLSMFVPLTRGGGSDRSATFRAHYVRMRTKLDDVKGRAETYDEAIAQGDSRLDTVLMKAFEAELRLPEAAARCVDIATQFQLVATLEQAVRLCHDSGATYLRDRLLPLVEARYKSKLRRQCKLPAPGTFVTEKERDRMIRQLLAKERLAPAPAAGGGAVAAAPGGAIRDAGSQAVVQDRAFEAATRATEPSVARAAALTPAKPVGAPVKSEAPAAAAAATPVHPQRTAVTAVPVVPPAPVVPKTSHNPFAKRAEVATASHDPPRPVDPMPAVKAHHVVPPVAATMKKAAAPLTPQKPRQPSVAATTSTASPAKIGQAAAEVPSPARRAPTGASSHVDPFMTASQAETDVATSTANWKGLEITPHRDTDLQSTSAASAAVTSALMKRYRDDDGEDLEAEEAPLRNVGLSFTR